MSEVVKIGGRTFTILFPDLLRPLTDEEYEDLRSHVRTHGVMCPVMVDESDGVIDGGHRLRVAAELKLSEVPTTLLADCDNEAKRDMALALNERRRHLTPEEMQRRRTERVKRVAEKRQEGKSLRVISQEEGISKSQVERDLVDATVPGGTVEPKDGKVKGKDGRERTAAPKKPPKPPEDAGDAWEGPASEQEAETDKEAARAAKVPRDALGYEIPKNLRDRFADQFLKETVTLLKGAIRHVQAEQRFYPYLVLDAFTNLTTDLISVLQNATPYVVHQACEGKGCKQCRLCGYLTKWRLQELEAHA